MENPGGKRVSQVAEDDDAKNYFNTEDEIDLNTDGVDLLSKGDALESGINTTGEEPSESNDDENDEHGGMTNAGATSYDVTTFHVGNGDDNDDDEEDRGIYLDDDIVQSVLRSSNERIQDQENRALRKCCLYGITGIAIFVVLAIIANSDVLMRGYIQSQGTAYHYNDREDFEREKDEHIIPDSDLAESMKYIAHFDNAANVRGPAYQPSFGEIPFLFTKGIESPSLEQTLSRCLGLVIAGDKPGPIELRKDELVIYSLDKETESRKYVNVDLTSTEGVQRAADLQLSQSGLPDVIMSNYLHMGLDALFSNEARARLFIIMKHPVDLAVSIYYDFTQNAAEEVLRTITLEEFINSKYYVGNVLTKIIWHGWGPETPTEAQLHIAQNVLRSKFLVGIYDDLWASIELFEDYFFWNEIGNTPEALTCKRELTKVEVQRELDMYRKVGEVKIGSPVYNRIIELNTIDMELYWFSVDLHKAQRAWIPTGK